MTFAQNYAHPFKCENFYQEFGHIFVKKLCLPKTVLKLMAQSKFGVNWQYVLKMESR